MFSPLWPGGAPDIRTRDGEEGVTMMSSLAVRHVALRSMVVAAITVAWFGTAAPFLGSQEMAKPTELTERDAYREFGYVPMKDGVRLAYVVWRPKATGRYPTVFVYGPYNENATAFRRVQRFVEAGYAFLGVNMRGTGC